MKTYFTELAELIANEKKAAFANDLARRIDDISHGWPTDGGVGLMANSIRSRPVHVPYILC